MVNLRHRSDEPEFMDGEAVTQAEFTACLEDLARVNTLTLARRPTLAFIDRALLATPVDHELSILDVGFGAGDMLRAIHRLSAKRGRRVRLTGIDLNPRSEPVARKATPPDMHIEFRTGDLFAWPEDAPVDIVISSLVTHHMRDEEILHFLSWMEVHARRGWFINDLHRHSLPYHGFRLLAAAMRWHAFVQHDGPLSIARAFHRSDWKTLLNTAQVAEVAQLQWWFPFRYCIERPKW